MRLVRTAVESRRASRALAKRRAEIAPIPPGTVDVVVYFADAPVNMYQVRQWYAPLAELSATHSVAIIARSPGTAMKLWDESPVPAVFLRDVANLERFVDDHDIKIVLYVNQNTRNFQMFRYGRMWHVFINHGESDKMYMTTNQFKAYDYSLIAGEAARERLAHKLWDFDLDRKTIQIGRPQADHFAGDLPFTPDDRMVVLYSPTWEGDRQSAAYGSVLTHGVALSKALLGTGRHRLIYRPHPRSGVLDKAFGDANREIIAAIAAANAADATAQHVYDDGAEMGWQLAAADVAITDVSAMVYDRLAVGKPLVVTRPTNPLADVDEAGYLGHAEWLTADAASDVVTVVERVATSEEAHRNLTFWVQRHFGDTSPGAATRRFHEAIDGLVAEWDRNALIHAGDARTLESDPDVDSDDD